MKTTAASSAWPLAVACAVLYCINQWAAHKNLTAVPLLLSASIGAATVAAIVLHRASIYVPIALLFSLFGFPEYSSNPYLTEYQSPFAYTKYLALFGVLWFVKPAPTRLGLIFIAITGIATLIGLQRGLIGDMWKELVPFCFIALVLNGKPGVDLGQRAALVFAVAERLFYLLIPMALFINISGIADERSGGTTVYFFGHWLGIIAALAVYRTVAGQSDVFGSKWVRLPLIIVTSYVVLSSFQSAHFILLALAIVAGAMERRAAISLLLPLALLVLMALSGSFILTRLSQDNWLYLKVSQLFYLFTGTFDDRSNSGTIRMSQLLSLFEQGNWWTILFGRGLASTYIPEGAFWNFVIFHEGTFPEKEISSGVLQYIHEPVVMLIKWGGLIGLSVAVLGIATQLKRTPSLGASLLAAALFIMLFTTSSQTGLLVTALFLFHRAYIQARHPH